MALVHEHRPERARDLALIGLAAVVFGIVAVAVPCVKMVIDQLFALF